MNRGAVIQQAGSAVVDFCDLVDAEALLGNLGDERMRAEFAAGIKYVRDCIPAAMEGLVSVDWRYLPASTLGGDTIGYHWVDEDHLALYLIDVTGHGLDPALLHRVAVIGSGTLDSLPHNGAVVTLLAVCGSTHRDSYRDIVMVGIVGALVALVAVIALGSMVGSF